MLDKILASLSSDEKVTLILGRDKKGRAKVILSSTIDLDPDDKDESRRQLKAAIAQPMVIHLDEGDSADAELAAAVDGFTGEQRSSRDALADYTANHASNRARASTAKAKPEKKDPAPEAAPSKAADAPEPTPAPSAPDSNPDTLF